MTMVNRDEELVAAHPAIRRMVTGIEALVAQNQETLQQTKSREIPEDWRATALTIAAPAGGSSYIPANLSDNAVQQILGRNSLRFDAIIVNTGANPCFLLRNKINDGFSLAAGASFTFNNKGPVYCWSPSGTTLWIAEEVYALDNGRNLDIGITRNGQPAPVAASFLE